MAGKKNKRNPPNSSLVPRALPQNPIVRRTIRYITSAGGTESVYRNCLLSLIAISSTAATNVMFPIQSIRVRKVEMWSLGGTDSSQRVAIFWGTSQGPTDEIVAYGNTAFPAHLVARPPAGSYAGMWQVHDPGSAIGSESNLVMQLSCSANCVLDLHFEMVAEATVTGIAAGDSAVGLKTTNTLGLGYTSLGNLNSAGAAAGTNIFIPAVFTQYILSGRTP
jgi:hypothetical protein